MSGFGRVAGPLVTRRHVAHSGRPFVVLALILALILGGVGALIVPDPSEAATIDNARREAAALADKLDKAGERLSVLDEDVNDAKVTAAELSRRLTVLEAGLTERVAELDAARARARSRALNAYTRPGAGADILAEPLGAGRSDVYADVVGSVQADAQDELREILDDLAVERAKVDKAKAASAAVTTRLRSSQETLLKEQADLERLLAQSQGRVAVLVEEEARRRDEAEAAQARAEAARREQLAREELARRATAAAAARARGTVPTVRGRPPSAASSSPPSPPSSPDGAPIVEITATTIAVAGETDAQLRIDAGVARVAPASSSAAKAVQIALAQVGKPYRWGNDGPGSFDCSGLMLFAWASAGRQLPHSSRAQFAGTQRVPLAQLQPGDLVFFGRPIHHVGMYIGDGLMVEASRSGVPVRTRSIHRRDFVGAGRVR